MRFTFQKIVFVLLLCCLASVSWSDTVAANDNNSNCSINGVDYSQAQGLIKKMQKIFKDRSLTTQQQAQQVSQWMSYPLLINLRRKNNQLSHMNITDQQEFLKKYQQIFTLPVRKAILNTNANDVFCNSNGGMAANGVIWFRGSPLRIFVVNLPQ